MWSEAAAPAGSSAQAHGAAPARVLAPATGPADAAKQSAGPVPGRAAGGAGQAAPSQPVTRTFPAIARSSAEPAAEGAAARYRFGNGPRYDSRNLVGAGSFGKVFLARDVVAGEVVAVKRQSADDEPATREYLWARAMRPFPHPNVLAVRDWWFAGGDMYTVFDLMDRDLHTIIKARKAQFATGEAAAIFRCMAAGVAHLHAHGVTHGDLSASNVLVNGHWRTGLDVRIADLGGAFTAGSLAAPGAGEVITTLTVRAPEVLLGDPAGPTSAIDAWALGVHGIVLATGTMYVFWRPEDDPARRKREPAGSRGHEDHDAAAAARQLLRRQVMWLGIPDEGAWPGVAGGMLRERFVGAEPPPSHARSLAEALVSSRFVVQPLCASPEAVVLLSGLLKWDPSQRFSCADASQTPLFSAPSAGDNRSGLARPPGRSFAADTPTAPAGEAAAGDAAASAAASAAAASAAVSAAASAAASAPAGEAAAGDARRAVARAGAPAPTAVAAASAADDQPRKAEKSETPAEEGALRTATPADEPTPLSGRGRPQRCACSGNCGSKLCKGRRNAASWRSNNKPPGDADPGGRAQDATDGAYSYCMDDALPASPYCRWCKCLRVDCARPRNQLAIPFCCACAREDSQRKAASAASGGAAPSKKRKVGSSSSTGAHQLSSSGGVRDSTPEQAEWSDSLRLVAHWAGPLSYLMPADTEAYLTAARVWLPVRRGALLPPGGLVWLLLAHTLRWAPVVGSFLTASQRGDSPAPAAPGDAGEAAHFRALAEEMVAAYLGALRTASGQRWPALFGSMDRLGSRAKRAACVLEHAKALGLLVPALEADAQAPCSAGPRRAGQAAAPTVGKAARRQAVPVWRLGEDQAPFRPGDPKAATSLVEACLRLAAQRALRWPDSAPESVAKFVADLRRLAAELRAARGQVGEAAFYVNPTAQSAQKQSMAKAPAASSSSSARKSPALRYAGAGFVAVVLCHLSETDPALLAPLPWADIRHAINDQGDHTRVLDTHSVGHLRSLFGGPPLLIPVWACLIHRLKPEDRGKARELDLKHVWKVVDAWRCEAAAFFGADGPRGDRACLEGWPGPPQPGVLLQRALAFADRKGAAAKKRNLHTDTHTTHTMHTQTQHTRGQPTERHQTDRHTHTHTYRTQSTHRARTKSQDTRHTRGERTN